MSLPNRNQNPEPPPPDPVTPPENVSGWVQYSLNQINERLDRVKRRFDQQDRRLRRIEGIVWVATGCVIIMTAIVGYVASLARDVLMQWLQQ